MADSEDLEVATAASNAPPIAKSGEEAPLIFDDVYQHVSSFGWYQRALYVGVNLLITPISLQFALLVFAMGTPRFHCDDDMTNSTSTCPPNKCCDNCTSYSFDGPFYSSVSEWNLICDRAYLGAVVQSSFFAGMLIGSVVGGWASDRFGRRLCLLVGTLFMCLFSFGTFFADCPSLLAFLRFGVGFMLASVMLCQYVYVIEMVGPKTRTMSGKVQDFFWDFGDVVVFTAAFLIREWRILILCCTIIIVPFLFFWRVLPDTARWLVSRGRIKEASDVLTKCGGKDGEPLDKEQLTTLLESIHKEEVRQQEKRGKGAKYSPLDLFRTPKLRKRSIIICFNWFVISLVSFGIYLYVTALAGNIYVNFLIMTLLSIPHLPISWFLMQKFGRRIPFCGYLLLNALFCLIIMGIPKEQELVVTGLAIFGKSLSSCAFNNIYLLSTEQFPTVLRNVGLGTGSMCARVGAMLSPFIVMLAQLPGFSLTLPVSIFGVLALLAAITSLWLPETFRSNLPQTIEELETTKEHYGIPCFSFRSKTEREDAPEGKALMT